MCHHDMNKSNIGECSHITSTSLYERVQTHNIRRGTVTNIYDIRTIRIYYNIFDAKKQILADIIMPPYIPEDIYTSIIHDLVNFFTDKQLSIVALDNNYVYLYHNKECINTMINNIITYRTSIENHP